MTTSLRAIAKCVELSAPISVRQDLVPLVVPPPPDEISVLEVMRWLEWFRCSGIWGLSHCEYKKLPVPNGLRSPSGEEAQILVDGIARKITLFMGWQDWELDWHIWLERDESLEEQLTGALLHDEGFFCEWMIVNRWEDEWVGRQWWSHDMDGILLLAPLPPPTFFQRRGATRSEDWSLIEDTNQGGDAETVASIEDPVSRGYSLIVDHGGRVYLQGAFVNDTAHGWMELHPLESIAYAVDVSSTGELMVLSARPDSEDWPREFVRWRVAAVTNSHFHRITSRCDFLRTERTTVWYLELPSSASDPGTSVDVVEASPGFYNTQAGSRFSESGVSSVDSDPRLPSAPLPYASFPVDPRDGRRKLKVTITMQRPDEREDGWTSGLFLRDYDIRVVR